MTPEEFGTVNLVLTCVFVLVCLAAAVLAFRADRSARGVQAIALGIIAIGLYISGFLTGWPEYWLDHNPVFWLGLGVGVLVWIAGGLVTLAQRDRYPNKVD